MKKYQYLLAAVVVILLVATLTTRHGLIRPAIGESGSGVSDTQVQVQDAPAEPDGTEAGDPGPGGGDESSSGGGSSEPVVAPVMTGSVSYRFYHEEMKSTSLGAMELFTAEALLYDELNAEGVNGVIHLTSGSSENYMTCVWTENEDGMLSLQTDEFNIFEVRDVEGVLTIVGIRYSLGMMNSGSVDIPLAQ